MWKEKRPEELDYQEVRIWDSSGVFFEGRAAFRKWTSAESFWRGFRKSAKIVLISIGVMLPFGFLDPFAFLIWGSLGIGAALLILGPFLHLKYWGEAVSFFFVESECPYCHTQGRLEPYISTSFEKTFTVICKTCGQTARGTQS